MRDGVQDDDDQYVNGIHCVHLPSQSFDAKIAPEKAFVLFIWSDADFI